MLNVSDVKRATPRQKPYKLYDERGLYLLVNPNGSRLWRFKYRFSGKEKLLALGSFPDVRLSVARQKRDEARRLLAEEGIDPGVKRRAERAAKQIATDGTFKAVAEEWLAAGCPGSRRAKRRPTAETIDQLRRRLLKYVYPYIGKARIQDLAIRDMRNVLDPVVERRRYETAHRLRSLCDRIFRYAIATERADRNIAADLKGTLAPSNSKGFSAITEEKQFAGLLRAIDGYEGQPTTAAALRLAPLLFLRPGELRAGEWSEIDFESRKWTVPEGRMKEKRPHIVPLSTQAVAILKNLEQVTGHGRFLFPSLRSPQRPISENTLNAALRRLGYSKEEQTSHGFRSSASSLIHDNDLGTEIDVELQLAHKIPGVAGLYNKSKRLKQRARMMQQWADYIEIIKARRVSTSFVARN